MAKTALAVLEEALRSRRLDRTICLPEGVAGAPWGSPARVDAAACAASELAALDACLAGGLPRGQLSEIAGPRSSGRTTLLLQLLAAATRRGEIAALVDTCDCLDVASAVEAGVDLDRLLWVRGHALASPSGAPGLQGPDRLVERALKALNLVLQAGGFGLVALDLADVPPASLARIPFTTWPRLQRLVEGRDTACLLVGSQPLARSAGGVTLVLNGAARWAGTHGYSRRLAGMDVTVRVVSPRRRIQGEVRVCGDLR